MAGRRPVKDAPGIRMIGPHIKAVFFDAVGTVLFPNPGVSQTYARVANRHGAGLTEDVVRGRLMPAFVKQEKIDGENGWTTSEDRERRRWQDIMAEVMPEADVAACFRDLWDHYTTPAAWRVPADVGPLLTALAGRGLILGLASNFDARLRPLAAGFPELAPVMGRLVISSLVGHRKPGRLFYAEVIRQAGVPPHEILYVGDDRRNDYDGALEAGMEAVLLAPDGAGPDGRVIRSLTELR